MTNDSATTRLLYAILSQKCLKDIDWNRVASNPIIGGEITNGHAARMRYSRFKKQMEGTSPAKRPRNAVSTSPKKTKVEKNVRRPKDQKNSANKPEESSSQESLSTPAPEPGYEPQGLGLNMGNINDGRVKREESEMRTFPITPSDSHVHSQTQPSSPSFGEMGLGGVNVDFAGYGLAQGMYQGYQMEVQLGLEGYEDLWQPQPHHQSDAQTQEGNPLVKNESRWDETYHPV